MGRDRSMGVGRSRRGRRARAAAVRSRCSHRARRSRGRFCVGIVSVRCAMMDGWSRPDVVLGVGEGSAARRRGFGGTEVRDETRAHDLVDHAQGFSGAPEDVVASPK